MAAFNETEESEDAVLLRQAAGGSPEAFALLVRTHQAAVRWYLVRCVRDPATADDLAQEVFLAAFRNLATCRSAASLGGWLRGIARNLAIQHVRTRIPPPAQGKGAAGDSIGPLADRAIGARPGGLPGT